MNNQTYTAPIYKTLQSVKSAKGRAKSHIVRVQDIEPLLQHRLPHQLFTIPITPNL